MNTLEDRDLQGILALFLKYERSETLLMEEWDALIYFEDLGYWLDSTEPLPLEMMTGEGEPYDTLATFTDDGNPDAVVTYYLRRGEA